MLNTYVRVDANQQPNDAADAARLHGEIRDKATAEVRAEFVNAMVENVGAGNCIRVIRAEQAFCIATKSVLFVAVIDINGVQHVVRGAAHHTRERIENILAESITSMVLRHLFNRKGP